MTTKVLIPDTFPEPWPAAETLPPDVELVGYSTREAVPAAHRDAEVLVVWANGRRNLGEAAQVLPELRWVQTLAAGPDAVLAAGFADAVTITSGRGLHDIPVAEHALALVLAGVRRLDLLVEARAARRWDVDLSAGGALAPTVVPNTLHGQHVLIWGFGSIAARLAPMLQLLGAEVTGVATSAGERGGVPVVADVDEALPGADVLVMILPSLEATRHALDARRLALLPRHAWVVNVGRGSTLDERALLAALESRQIAGAALDVFEAEPLPESSPLWAAPNVILSPHIAGNRPIGAAALLADNLHRFVSGRELRNVVPR